MACALETDPINQLEENLRCSVCLETLKDPRTLPCFHSFCKDCLEGVVKTCRDEAPRDQPAIREFHCPNCRVVFTLDPNKHVADMPRNHFICNMVQATAILDRGTRVPCSHNCSQGFSVARCVTCEKFLCRECLAIHDTYRGHDGHSVLSMEELSKPENRKKIQGKMYCDEHSGELLKVYCETCDQLICKDCMDFQHLKQDHSCLLVKDVVNKYKELITSKNTAVENALKEGNAFLRELLRNAILVNQDAENTKRKIIQNKDAMLKNVSEILEREAETLLNEVEQSRKRELTKFDRRTEETKHYVENIKQSVQLSKTLVQQGTEEEIISSQKMMLDSANNLLAKRPEFLYRPIRRGITNYNPHRTRSEQQQLNEEEILKLLENSLGCVEFKEGSQVNKSRLNPSAQPFSTSTNSSSKPGSYSNAVKGNASNVKGQNRHTDLKEPNDDMKCSICLCDFTNKKTLDKCGHSFCSGCIDEAFKYEKKCPICSQVYGPLFGDQPPGKMSVSYTTGRLPGFESCGSIIITYRFESGLQGFNHPNPGKPYQGTQRIAYLPDNKEGQKVLQLLDKAFAQRLTFTIGRSTTTGANNVITWNGISHKTNQRGGPTGYGYPDPDYLKRVQDQLAARGIAE